MSALARKEGFLNRWSRLKREVAGGAVPPGTTPAAPAPAELPSMEALAAQGMDADLSVFMQAQVEESVRRAAVQQLFRQPIFNVMDGLDVYIEDFNAYEPIPADALRGLAHARDILFPPDAAAQPAATASSSGAAAAVERTAEVAATSSEPPHE